MFILADQNIGTYHLANPDQPSTASHNQPQKEKSPFKSKKKMPALRQLSPDSDPDGNNNYLTFTL